MSTTTAADLLDRADRLTRTLREHTDPVGAAQWEPFDVAFHRVLHEIVGADAAYVPRADPQQLALRSAIRSYPAPLRPPADIPLTPMQAARLLDITRQAVYRRIRTGNLHVARDGDAIAIRARDLDARPDLTPPDPTDPHPMARLGVTLGALADLLHGAHEAGQPVLDQPGEAAATTRHILAIGLVAAGYAVGRGPYADANRPLAVAQYAERVLDTITNPDITITSLDRLRAVAPLSRPATLNDRLEAALHHWEIAATAETYRAVPSTDVLRTLANQSTHVFAVTSELLTAAPDADRIDPDATLSKALVEAAKAARATDVHLAALTTLARPSVGFAAASRDLFTVLGDISQELQTPGKDALDRQRALNDLGAATHTIADLWRRTRDLPDRLARSGLLHTPKAHTRPTMEDLTTKRRMHTRVAPSDDVAPLTETWHLAAAATMHISRQIELRLPAARHVARETGPTLSL